MKRNSLAHEEIKSHKDIISKWNDICSMTIEDKNGEQILLNQISGESIVNICEIVTDSISPIQSFQNNETIF